MQIKKSANIARRLADMVSLLYCHELIYCKFGINIPF